MNTSAKELGHFDHLKWTGHYRDLYSCFRATDARSGQEVTLRLFDLRHNDPDLPGRIDAALDELLFLRHPNLIPVWEAGETNGVPYLVTAAVVGQTLAELLAQQSPSLPPAQSTAILEQIRSALEYLHQCGSVHGDLRPETVIVTADGVVQLDAACMRQLAAPPADKTGTISDFGSFDQDFGRPDTAHEDNAQYDALSRLLRTGIGTEHAHKFLHPEHTTVAQRVVPVIVVDSGRPAAMLDPRLFDPAGTMAQGKTPSPGIASMNAQDRTQEVGIGRQSVYPDRIIPNVSSQSPSVMEEIRMSTRSTTLVSLAVLVLLLMTAYLLWQPFANPSAQVPELSVSAGGSTLPTATPTKEPDTAELPAGVGTADGQPQGTATPDITDAGTKTDSAQPSLTPTATITPTATVQPSPATSAEVTATLPLASSTTPAQNPTE